MTASRMRSISTGLAIAAVVILGARAAAQRDDAMVACVEGGGIYYEDGRCEGGTRATPTEAAPEPGDTPPDTAASEPKEFDEDREAAEKKKCRKQGGRYRKDGTCEVRRDPIEQCKADGGIFMNRGVCYRPAR